jgi:hypothetical protein
VSGATSGSRPGCGCGGALSVSVCKQTNKQTNMPAPHNPRSRCIPCKLISEGSASSAGTGGGPVGSSPTPRASQGPAAPPRAASMSQGPYPTAHAASVTQGASDPPRAASMSQVPLAKPRVSRSPEAQKGGPSPEPRASPTGPSQASVSHGSKPSPSSKDGKQADFDRKEFDGFDNGGRGGADRGDDDPGAQHRHCPATR